jgi:hypothetical protein
MAWLTACFCGYSFEADPPACCPRCGVTITEGTRTPLIDAWIVHMRDEIGDFPATDGVW